MAKDDQKGLDKPQESVTVGILKEMGLVSEKEMQEYVKGKPKKKLLDILKQDVTVQAVKDLLTYEIPFSMPWKEKEKLRDKLRSEGLIDLGDLENQIETSHNFEDNLRLFLVNNEYVNDEQFVQAHNLAQDAGIPTWRALINLKYVEPNVLTEFIKDKQNHSTEQKMEDTVLQALENRGALNDLQVKELKEAGVSLGQIVSHVQNKMGVSYQDIADVLMSLYGIQQLEQDDYVDDYAAYYSIPDTFVRRHKAIPMRKVDNMLEVAMINPLDQGILDQVRMITGLEGKALLISEENFQSLYKRLYEGKKTEKNFLDDGEVAIQKDASTVQLVASIIEGAIKARATDIHFESGSDDMRVRYRIDGLLYDVTHIDRSQKDAVVARLKILAEMDITQKRRPQDGHFSVTLPGHRYNLRISSVPTYLGEKVVIRILDETNVVRGIQQLGLPPRELMIVEGLIHRPHGMILATGPMGSGKTTTLYACLNELDILHQNIITIENPVEYQLPGITQIQVNPENGVTFSDGLRAVLRQDADVIMVGEIRDPDTSHVAIWAALTGHLVLSTLHTNDTAGAVTMFSNLNIPHYLIAGALNGIISSRLVRKLCGNCREEFQPDEYFLRFHKLEELKGSTLYRAVGCRECYYTGYQGLTGVYEVMPISEHLRHEIAGGANEVAIEKVARDEGMHTLWENGLVKVKSGETTLEEIQRKILR